MRKKRGFDKSEKHDMLSTERQGGIMALTELKNPYICVNYGGVLSYGGNQMGSSSGNFSACGCGVVAGLDLLLYLCH